MKRWTLREKLSARSDLFSTPEVLSLPLSLSLSSEGRKISAAGGSGGATAHHSTPLEQPPPFKDPASSQDPAIAYRCTHDRLISFPFQFEDEDCSMDPQGGAMMNDGGVYNFAEIWQGFHMNPAAAASFAAGVPLDPMPMDDRSNQSSPGSNRNYRKRRHEEELAKGGVSTSNSITNVAANGGDNREALSNENHQNLAGKEGDPGKAVDKPAKSAEPPKQDYIHVRARRGQATDSHSLAERARREKISERMKILQDLVPGCNKIIGKALVLDEIINYIQSLQRQVEFLSMKLETVNTRVGIDGYPSKDFTPQTFDASGMAFGSQSTREYGRSSSPEWLHMQIGGGFERPQ